MIHRRQFLRSVAALTLLGGRPTAPACIGCDPAIGADRTVVSAEIALDGVYAALARHCSAIDALTVDFQGERFRLVSSGVQVRDGRTIVRYVQEFPERIERS